MAPIYFPIPLTGITFNSDSYTGGSVPAKFDAFLYKPTDRWSQLKLTIKLRINLRQLPPKPIPLALDADGNPFWTLPWSNAGWAAFIVAAAAQANMWNNNFWLLPPASFSGFDEVYELDPFSNTVPNKAFRPNIRCALDVDFAATDDAQRTIDVANLNPGMLVLQGKPLNPGTFRSHALLYDSLDTVPWAFPYGPGPGQPTVHYVIAHEIGHAMGLGHIGTILKTPLCQLAVAGENIFPSAGSPLSGGRNALVCYGFNQGLAIAGNIMGAGDKFTVDNAWPWRWALSKLIGKMIGGRPLSEYAQWRVVMRDPGPGSWIDNGLDVQEQEPVAVPVRITANDDSLITISGDVLFDINKWNLKPEANAVLEQAAAAIKAKTGPRLRLILINGHTDDTGSQGFNQPLSESRAKAVADWFFSRKYLKESNTRTQGFGKTQPRVPNTDAAGRAKNRRVEIYLVNN